jgi:hypothetical protein
LHSLSSAIIQSTRLLMPDTTRQCICDAFLFNGPRQS